MTIPRAVEAARRWADAHRELVIICVALPLSTAATAWQNIYPLLAYPCKVIDKGGMVRLPGNRGTPYSGRTETATFLDIGVYGFPQRVKDGDEQYPAVTKVRALEQKARSLGGFLHTYCDVFSTEEEFLEMFDHALWRQMRERYQAEGTFPTIYQKVKPEMDPLQFLAQEAAWEGTSVRSGPTETLSF